MDILQLYGYRVTKVEATDHDYHIDAEPELAFDVCPHCLNSGNMAFGRRRQMIHDLPIHGKRVAIHLNNRRFRCRACNKTFFQFLSDVDSKRQMTERLVRWIGAQAVTRTFTSIAEEIGVSEGTVRLVFKEHTEAELKAMAFETPKWLGIDEIYLIKPRCILTNVEERTVLDILTNRNKETVIRYLSRMDNRDRVEFVAMDMWTPYRDAVGIVLPNAKVVVDKFHVVRMANDAVERVRKSLRAGMTPKQKLGLKRDRFLLLKRHGDLSDQELFYLDGWVNSYPDLFKAYRLKEEFYMIYDAVDAQEAAARYQVWRHAVPDYMLPAFGDLIRAWTNWEPYILNHFAHKITNAYTESLNNLIRATDRMGRGYSFDVMRAKLLLSQRAQKTHRPKFSRYIDGMIMHLPQEEYPTNLGPDITTLAQEIEESFG